ncbi:endo alpha-1,4 polygalactosaminidase [Streptomyces sp. NPDC094149]|uniref:endo alpha-1,4 polygalactosaminidase n=1 Tax=Streptomyces sp. NPDC094149 TaxID=3155079 RepID=UPI003322C0BE
MSKHSLPPLLRRKGSKAIIAAAVAATVGAGVAFSQAFADQTATSAATQTVTPPTANAKFDYQIGGAYTPPTGVKAVSRDRGASPAAGLYNICYVNAFQTQPDELDWWKSKHPDLLLKDSGGDYVIDEGWDEVLLDTSTAAKRDKLAAVVGGWIKGCADSGYQAVEPDNLDSYERSDGRLTKSNNAAFATLLAQKAHAAGLAIAQKNTTDLLSKGKTIGFDFAVAEECGRFDECGDYASTYNNRVFVIEYRSSDFDKTCSKWGSKLSVVRRNVAVSPKGSSGYVFKTC